MLLKIYNKLLDHFKPQNWWPTSCKNKKFEIIVGAILTQQTSWRNVEKAIKNLEREKKLDENSLHNTNLNDIERLIRPSGFYRIKAGRLKNFLGFLFKKYNGILERLFCLERNDLRKELLSINGIGKETADCIVLYAAEKPIFVIDAYTHRIFNRIGLINWVDYEKTRNFFESKLRRNVKLFKEFHALIVQLGKNICKPKPKCDICPLNKMCDYAISINNRSKG